MWRVYNLTTGHSLAAIENIRQHYQIKTGSLPVRALVSQECKFYQSLCEMFGPQNVEKKTNVLTYDLWLTH